MNIHSITGLAFLMLAIGACTNPKEPGQETTQTQTPAFVFSTIPTETVIRSTNNWCSLPFEEAVVINAETTNLNRRYFAVGNGIYKVVVRKGTTAAPFMLQRRGASLEVLTSDQFPTCLARRSYFSVIEDGRTLKYTNPPYYDFRVDAEPWQNAFKVTLEFPPGTDYSLIVHRQKNMD